VLDSLTAVLGMKVEQGESAMSLLLKINRSTTTSMKTSRRELSIEMVIHRSIFKNNQITHFSCFTFISTTGVSFYCAPVLGINVKRGERNLAIMEDKQQQQPYQ